jgi:hypothetical protein
MLPSSSCSCLRVAHSAWHGPLQRASLSVCFCCWRSSAILTGNSLGDTPNVLTLDTQVQKAAFEPSPSRLSAASRGPSSHAVTALPHQADTISLLPLVWGGGGANVVVTWGAPKAILSHPGITHVTPNPQTYCWHARHPAPGWPHRWSQRQTPNSSDSDAPGSVVPTSPSRQEGSPLTPAAGYTARSALSQAALQWHLVRQSSWMPNGTTLPL